MTQEVHAPVDAAAAPEKAGESSAGLLDRIVAVGRASRVTAADVRFVQENREVVETTLRAAHERRDAASRLIHALLPVVPLYKRDVTVHESSGEAWRFERDEHSSRYESFTSDRKADVVPSHELWTLYLHGGGPNTSQGRAVGRKVIKRFPSRDAAEREAARWLSDAVAISTHGQKFTAADLR